jgi:hypothetical protein
LPIFVNVQKFGAINVKAPVVPGRVRTKIAQAASTAPETLY